jgi:hypothetical protein
MTSVLKFMRVRAHFDGVTTGILTWRRTSAGSHLPSEKRNFFSRLVLLCITSSNNRSWHYLDIELEIVVRDILNGIKRCLDLLYRAFPDICSRLYGASERIYVEWYLNVRLA